MTIGYQEHERPVELHMLEVSNRFNSVEYRRQIFELEAQVLGLRDIFLHFFKDSRDQEARMVVAKINAMELITSRSETDLIKEKRRLQGLLESVTLIIEKELALSRRIPEGQQREILACINRGDTNRLENIRCLRDLISNESNVLPFRKRAA